MYISLFFCLLTNLFPFFSGLIRDSLFYRFLDQSSLLSIISCWCSFPFCSELSVVYFSLGMSFIFFGGKISSMEIVLMDGCVLGRRRAVGLREGSSARDLEQPTRS